MMFDKMEHERNTLRFTKVCRVSFGMSAFQVSNQHCAPLHLDVGVGWRNLTLCKRLFQTGFHCFIPGVVHRSQQPVFSANFHRVLQESSQTVSDTQPTENATW